MKTIILTVCSAVMATASLADSDPKYNDPDVILGELRNLQQDCSTMEPGQTRVEIFGIKFSRDSMDTCRFSNGELDDLVRVFLHEQNLKWAGVDGEHGLWVTVTGSSN